MWIVEINLIIAYWFLLVCNGDKAMVKNVKCSTKISISKIKQSI